MAFREVHRMEVVEVLRRWQQGESKRSIARATGLSRNTVDKYLSAAAGRGGEAPDDGAVTELVRLNWCA